MEKKRAYKASFDLLKNKFERKWMMTHGRGHMLDFTD